MKLLAWNILHGGGKRADQIFETIASHDPDLISLTEFQGKAEEPIRQTLEWRGWTYVQSTEPVGRENGICVLSRTPIQRTGPSTKPPGSAVRWLDIDLVEKGFGLTVVNIPGSGLGVRSGEKRGSAKSRFWEALLDASEARIREPLLLLGDFNTGLHGIDEVGSTFYSAEHFARLSALGWTDVWRNSHGQKKEYTWYSSLKDGRVGNGFRLDHAFATPSLLPRISDCRYSHVERERKISDHSLMIVELK